MRFTHHGRSASSAELSLQLASGAFYFAYNKYFIRPVDEILFLTQDSSARKETHNELWKYSC